MILPELKGSPTVLIKNNSEALKNFNVKGKINLKTKIKTNTEKIVAKEEVLRLVFFEVLKKYNITIAGITNKESMCTPNDNPVTKLISTNHLFPLGVSSSLSHFKPSQNKSAIKKEDIAYTSPSTALNQKLSEKV